MYIYTCIFIHMDIWTNPSKCDIFVKILKSGFRQFFYLTGVCDR